MKKALTVLLLILTTSVGACAMERGCPVECNDGTCSGCSESGSGCCSWHGGIAGGLTSERSSGATEEPIVITVSPEPSEHRVSCDECLADGHSDITCYDYWHCVAD